MKKEKISIVVPCFNEEEALPIFYKEFNKIVKKMDYVNFELIFIDDGSKDDTLNILRNYSKKDDNVKYISFSRNFGKEAGMFAGFERATGDYVAVMDVDLQDPPVMLIEMYDRIKKSNCDIVGLYTTCHNDYGFFRKTFTNLWYKFSNKLIGFDQKGGARDFRLMKKKVCKSITSMKEYNRYIKGMYGYVGFKTEWIEYEAPDRMVGESKFSFSKLVNYALEGITSFSTAPLILATTIGLIFCLVAFVAILIIIFKTLVFGDPIGGWPSLACIIIFSGGIQLFFMGVLGYYLSKIYLEVKSRPVYIISESSEDLI